MCNSVGSARSTATLGSEGVSGRFAGFWHVSPTMPCADGAVNNHPHRCPPPPPKALCGPRVFTFFLYLSDVEEGGGTRFPYLNATVQVNGQFLPAGRNT